MPSSQRCAVIGCSIKKRHIKDWHNEYCALHERKRLFCECICPIKLYPFPTEMKDSEKRKQWISNISRTSPTSKRAWTPKPEDMVCNKHFMHGCPSQENPDPNVLMGHGKIKSKSTRRVLCKIEPKLEQQSFHKRKTPKVHSGIEFDNTENMSMCQNHASSFDVHARRDVEVQTDMKVISDICVQTEYHENTPQFDHSYSAQNCNNCIVKDRTINSLTQKLRKNNQKLRGSVEYRYLQNDKKIRFYTGIHDRTTFYALYGFLSSDAENLRYWKGKKTSQSVNKGGITSLCKQRRDNKRILSAKDELVLVLMKLRLGLTSEDLADRFSISEGLCSQIINTWVKFLSDKLRGLVQFPPKEVVMRNIPKAFKNEYANTRVIIDCTEIFIERPRDLYIQAVTWSDYKKHNTVKFLVGITPLGMISYISETWGGRTSDKQIVVESGFLNLLDPYDLVMADRGFPIKEELLLRRARLAIPPGARGKEQMASRDVKITKKVANLRIHVERAINRLKMFKILKETLPITLLPIVDDIINVIAALCNLLPPLVSSE